jgi:hypothetical protein
MGGCRPHRPQEGTQGILWGIEIGELVPRQIILHVRPDPRERARCWAVGRQADQLDVLWQGELLGRMGATGVQSAEIEALRKGLRDGLDEELTHLRVQRGPRQQAPVTRGGLHGAIDIAPREDMLDGSNWLRATGGEAPPTDGQEADAAFIVAKAPDGAGVRRGDRPLEVFLTGGLEGWDGLRLLWCDGGAAR